MKRISISLDERSISQAIKECEKFREFLETQTPKFLNRIAELGVQIASVRFAGAQYDGTNDVSCKIEERGDNCRAIVATGTATLFIEFGTGVAYPDVHPEAGQNGMIRGSFGQGKGKQTSWGYYGDAGTNGKVVTNKKGKEVVITQGNPANMPMYLTVSQLQQEFERIAREVFNYE